MLRLEVGSVAVRRVVDLEDAVDHTLGLLADGHGCTVEELLAAAARHVARVQGGLRQPRWAYREAEIEIPEPVDGPRPVPAPMPAPTPIRRAPRHELTVETLRHLDDVVRLYRDELRTLREVAAEVGIAVATVRRLLEHADVAVRPRGWVPGKRIAS